MRFIHTQLIVIALAGSLAFAEPGVWNDPEGDAVIRRTDVGNDAVLAPGFTPIDLIRVQIDGWLPGSPVSDAYTGSVIAGDAEIMRMQIVFAGLVSPPGPLALDGPVYNPTQFGDRPAYGYFEIDIDDQKNSGGELMPLAKNRYLANVGRFSQSPIGSISDRIVREALHVDSDFFSDPQFERSGNEFTLAMCGCFEPSIVAQNGNSDSIFDVGETWILSGRFFERIESYRIESALFGGSDFGLFDPIVELQFVHDPIADQTTITLVFPITQLGAAILDGGSEQAIDLSLVNHTSIEEALDDLIAGVPFTSGALRQLVDSWEDSDPTHYRQPTQWHIRALIGTAPTVPDQSSLFVWTDAGFGEVFGDLDGDELSNWYDANIISDRISDLDGSEDDADGTKNNQVSIPNFGFAFDFSDLNGDGLISDIDVQLVPCRVDLNADGVLNFFDISAFLVAFSSGDLIVDFNLDGVLNFFDISLFLSEFSAQCS